MKLTKEEYKLYTKEQKKAERLRKREENKEKARLKRENSKPKFLKDIEVKLDELKGKFKKIDNPKDKSEEYIFKRNSIAKVSRVILWAILILFFIKGVASSLKRNSMDEINHTIASFKNEFSSYKDTDNEVLAFAQNFAREYLTYQAKSEADYRKRLEPYASGLIINTAFNFKGDSEVLYAQAYRKEDYSDNQSDVYVFLDLKYKTRNLAEDKITYVDVITSDSAVLKVPVRVDGNKYIAEDIPVFVNDKFKIENLDQTKFSGKEVEAEEKELIKTSLSSFYKYFYEDEQNAINYYLSKDADKNKFVGLNKRFRFDKIENFTAIQRLDGNVVALVTVVVKDINDALIPQKFNLVMSKQDNKYYIEDMNTKNINLNIKMEE